MAGRNMTQTAAAAEKIPALYDMTAEEQEEREEATAALADLIAEAQTATTSQIKTVCSFLRKNCRK